MQLRLGFVVVLLIGLTAPALADRRSEAKDLVAFGMDLAQKGLWREAVQRWEQAVERDKTYAAAWNDLGIGYEQLGKFTEARTAYEKALAADPSNQFIKSNYLQFREIYDRQNKRRVR
jgi:Flp pilus assembly protein TadD